MKSKFLLSVLTLAVAGAARAIVFDLEPNNLPANTGLFSRVGPGPYADIVVGNLYLGDADWFKIHLNEGDLLSAIAFPFSPVYSTPDTYLGLIDPAGTSVLVGSDDDGTDPGDEYGSALRYQALTAGDYYIALAGYNNTFYEDDIESYTGENGDGVIDSDEVGSYTLVVGVAPVPEPAPFAGLGLGALCVLRRRRRA